MRQKQSYKCPVSAMLWSILFPGLGQLYNRDYIPAFLLIVLEFIINLFSHLNEAILFAFSGDFSQSHAVIDYQWGLFYPSIYGFAIWQAYNQAKEINNKNNYLGENKLEKKCHFMGFFFGMVIGMDLGLFWHNHQLIETLKYLNFLHIPVFNGLVLGLAVGLIGAGVEKGYWKKQKLKERYS